MRYTVLFLQTLALSRVGLAFLQASPRDKKGTAFCSTTQQRRHDCSKAFLLTNYQDEDEDEFNMAAFSRRIPETAFGSEVVPEGQRPINEYLDLQRAPLFGWATLGNVGLAIRLLLVYTAVFSLVGYPIAGATFTQDGYQLQKIASANVGALSLLMLLLLRFYAGWSYIGQRLSSNIVEYEETGWYDGDFERKTKSKCVSSFRRVWGGSCRL